MKVFRKIVTSIAIDASIEIVRGYVLQRLSKVTALDLQQAIKEGRHTLGVMDNKDHAMAKRWTPVVEKLKIDGKQLRRDRLTADNIFDWLYVDRPDLAKVIVSMKAEGRLWLENDVKEMYNSLFPPTPIMPQPAAPAQLAMHLKLKKPVTVEVQPQSIVKVDQASKENPQQP